MRHLVEVLNHCNKVLIRKEEILTMDPFWKDSGITVNLCNKGGTTQKCLTDRASQGSGYWVEEQFVTGCVKGAFHLQIINCRFGSSWQESLPQGWSGRGSLCPKTLPWCSGRWLGPAQSRAGAALLPDLLLVAVLSAWWYKLYAACSILVTFLCLKSVWVGELLTVISVWTNKGRVPFERGKIKAESFLFAISKIFPVLCECVHACVCVYAKATFRALRKIDVE